MVDLVTQVTEEFKDAYDPEIMVEWANQLAEHVVMELTGMEQPFKYIVHVMTTPPDARGVMMKSGCLWEHGLDGTVTVRFDSNEYHHYVTVFALAL